MKKKKNYERPACEIVKTMIEVALLSGSQNGVTKGDPNHGGEDNLSKSNPFGYDEFSGVNEWED
ncbi:hypothetical protein KZO74_02790 [Prevotella salivae]|uniref:hypothetical protein n=1 Tax=Segatella salivae TaxID=228604 RepID=UPI001C5FE721|nr:hypothetical protein [Segatella salivae]MBW4763945.1 hypothetical protein [Segatella salivae]